MSQSHRHIIWENYVSRHHVKQFYKKKFLKDFTNYSFFFLLCLFKQMQRRRSFNIFHRENAKKMCVHQRHMKYQLKLYFRKCFWIYELCTRAQHHYFTFICSISNISIATKTFICLFFSVSVSIFHSSIPCYCIFGIEIKSYSLLWPKWRNDKEYLWPSNNSSTC